MRVTDSPPAEIDWTCKFIYSEDCANDMCVYGAVLNYTDRTLKEDGEQQNEVCVPATSGDQMDGAVALTHVIISVIIVGYLF